MSAVSVVVEHFDLQRSVVPSTDLRRELDGLPCWSKVVRNVLGQSNQVLLSRGGLFPRVSAPSRTLMEEEYPTSVCKNLQEGVGLAKGPIHAGKVFGGEDDLVRARAGLLLLLSALYSKVASILAVRTNQPATEAKGGWKLTLVHR